jgi:peptide alpha-N-acetyltransferase
MEDEEEDATKHGHVTSLSVLRTHRKCGLATELMRSSHKRMEESFDANFSALHVRETNAAAFHLYSQTLAYDIHEIEKGYYADGEDAYDMRKYFKQRNKASPYELEQQRELASKAGAGVDTTPPPPPPLPGEVGGGEKASG